MASRVLILGGGTGGTLTANRLRRMSCEDDLRITVVDEDDRHVYQPGLLFVPFGMHQPDKLVRSRRAQLRSGIDFVESTVDHVDLDARAVHLTNSKVLPYDVLVIASGSRLVPEETEGLVEAQHHEKALTFYDAAGSSVLARRLSQFAGGRIVVNFVDLPIKCPVAPLEFCFLADWYFRVRGVRDRIELTFVTPLDGAFTKPVSSRVLSWMLDDKGVQIVTQFNTGQVDADRGHLVSYDGREVPFDLAVVVPLHAGADFVGRSPGLGDELNFVMCDEHTLQSKADPNVFVVGDAAALPTSKAGSVAHFEGELLVDNIRRFLAEEALEASFDGHTNCFIESGFGKALLVDFNYEVEPQPGRYPWRFGLPLLKQSRLNHLGKLMFEKFYWHVLLPGRSLPGVRASMPLSGKRVPPGSDHKEG